MADPRQLAAALSQQSQMQEEVQEQPQGGDPVIAALADMLGIPPDALIMSIRNALGGDEVQEGQKI